MIPYEIIGHYEPTKWNPQKVLRELIQISREHGLQPLPIGSYRLHKTKWKSFSDHADLMRRRPKNDTTDSDWHQDGDTTGTDRVCGLVLWSSNTPTEIRWRGAVYVPPRRSVVLIDNTQVYHRRPPESPRVRWFFRQRVKI